MITEVFSDPAGPDDGQEWFEIYNASDRPRQLEGLSVVHARGDGSMQRTVTIGALSIEPGGYAVLGNVLQELAPAWVDFGYATRLGDLYNTGTGRLALRCGTEEIDATTYGDAKSGLSRQLDGKRPPDYTVNDDQTYWCSAAKTPATEFSPGNFGTPGAVNGDCEIIVAGMCDDEGVLRPVVPPGPGDLAITEIMTNPSAVEDGTGEWFEVQAIREVDLNGIAVDRVGDSSAPEVIRAERCLRVRPGEAMVFARSNDPGANGGLPRVDATFRFTLVSGSASAPGDLAITYNATLVDAVTWTSSRAGKALQIDPDAANATDNDDFANFCDATTPYGDGDLGTPGSPNAQCPSVAPPGTCLAGASPRPIVAPGIGDLVITEVMPNPAAVSDTVGEWLEVVATRDVDLNGVGIDRASDAANPNVISSAACVRLAAGERAVFARSSDPAVNGGLPPVTAGFSFALVSGSTTSPGDVQLVFDGVLLDAVTWTSSTSGGALQLDPDFTNPIDNDLATSWCAATLPYGAGDLGTPGMANPACAGGPTTGMCLDGGAMRAIVAPVVGDLVITEVMPNPGAVADTVGEWFEVRVTRDVDLNGVGLDRATDASSPVVISSLECVRAIAGSHLVFARSADPAVNGGLPTVTHTFGFALLSGSAASPGDVQVALGATTLDSYLWTRSSEGASLQVDPAYADVTGNDDEANSCDGSMPYGDGDLGSPGAANATCMITPPANMCDDGVSSRPVVKPLMGQLVITEIMPNPRVEPGQEWFEIANVGITSFDLNGLGLDRANDTRMPDVVSSATCRSIPPGGLALLARSTDPAINGELPVPDGIFGFSMVNTSGELRVLDGATVLDAVAWATSTDGISSQLDPDHFTTIANDSSASWCASTGLFGDLTNRGTPRAANEQCP